jgi:hypothetical protein
MIGTNITPQEIIDTIRTANIYNFGQTILNRITFISIFIMFLFFLRIFIVKFAFPKWNLKKEIEDTIIGIFEISIVASGLVQIVLCLIYL